MQSEDTHLKNQRNMSPSKKEAASKTEACQESDTKAQIKASATELKIEQTAVITDLEKKDDQEREKKCMSDSESSVDGIMEEQFEKNLSEERKSCEQNVLTNNTLEEENNLLENNTRKSENVLADNTRESESNAFADNIRDAESNALADNPRGAESNALADNPRGAENNAFADNPREAESNAFADNSMETQINVLVDKIREADRNNRRDDGEHPLFKAFKIVMAEIDVIAEKENIDLD